MGAKNSYFKIMQGENGVKMTVYPPEGNGIRLKIDDVIKYLSKFKIEGFDLGALNTVITGCDKPTTISLSGKNVYPINESMEVIVSPDKMFAICRFYAESNEGSSMTKYDIEEELRHNGIKYGILEDAIEKYVDDPVYNTGIILAMGKKPVDGTDAEITYNFKVDRVAKPHYNEDGTVDFHKLDNINHVHAGDILAVLKKEEPGEPGKDVLGNNVMPRKVQRLILKHGKDISLSEDGLKLTSNVDGHVTLEGDRVFVSDVYNVGADVDASTGDIEYSGSIEVVGNVRTGFSLVAEGNVEIRGVVEGANITAKGDIILHRGVQGMGKAKLTAGGNIISKFIESAIVKADGYIETDTILHSDVSAKGNITVCGKNGSIIGGEVRATSLIEAGIIGSTMGTMTLVEVGCEPGIHDRAINIKKELTNLSAEREKHLQTVTLLKKKKATGPLDPAKTKMLVESLNMIMEIDKNVEELNAEYSVVIAKLEENRSAKIVVNKDIYPGAKVSIAEDYILIHDAIGHCKFEKRQGEIKPIPLF